MTRSDYVRCLERLQTHLRPLLKEHGFRGRGRTHNRATPDGLTLVVNFQMGASDPPGTTYVPGLRENLYGLFTVNLGVYVPEVARHHGGGEAKAWVQDYHCAVRTRLGNAGHERQDLWWSLTDDPAVRAELWTRLDRDGFPFLHRYESRHAILDDWETLEARGNIYPMRIVCATILAGLGRHAEARRHLSVQVKDTRNPGHPDYVRGLAQKLGLGRLDDQ